jgi:hypothetical protein
VDGARHFIDWLAGTYPQQRTLTLVGGERQHG